MMPTVITIKGLGSFAKEQTFEFPAHHGLYYMTGRNDAEPRLGRNGAGKTTLWRALTWVMFDKDARGLRAGDIANWAAPKGARVQLEFEHDGKAWMVTRTHAPNSWVLTLPDDVMGTQGHGGTEDLAKEEHNPVYAMLRLEFSTWLNTVLMAQGEPMFLDLKSGPQAELFSDVMGLDRWMGYSKRASVLASAEDSKIREFEISMSALRGHLERLSAYDLSDDIRAWDNQKSIRLHSVADDYERALANSKELKKRLDSISTGEGSSLDKKLNEAVAIENGRRTLMDEMSRRHREADVAFAVADSKAKSVKATYDELIQSDICPTCGAGGVKASAHATKLKNDVIRLTQHAADLFGTAKAASRKFDSARDAALTASETARHAHEAAQGYARDLNAARTHWEAAESKLDTLDDEAQRIHKELNPYVELQRERTADTLRLEKELDALAYRARTATERYERLGFWIRGFKDIRLRLIAEALQELAIEVNSCVTALGLIGWELVFAIDAETKSGTISRGFTVHVRSPHNERAVPWAAWSGGEAQRLRLAAQMGLTNLIRSSTGADIPLEVWDEPTDGMSDSGIQDLMVSLTERAQSERRQIWVVDHRAIDYGNFKGEVTVVKDKNGSRFEVAA